MEFLNEHKTNYGTFFLHHLWNVVVMQVVCTFQIKLIEKKAVEVRTEETTWYSKEIVFRTTVLQIGYHEILFSVIFRVLHLTQPGHMADWLAV